MSGGRLRNVVRPARAGETSPHCAAWARRRTQPTHPGALISTPMAPQSHAEFVGRSSGPARSETRPRGRERRSSRRSCGTGRSSPARARGPSGPWGGGPRTVGGVGAASESNAWTALGHRRGRARKTCHWLSLAVTREPIPPSFLIVIRGESRGCHVRLRRNSMFEGRGRGGDDALRVRVQRHRHVHREVRPRRKHVGRKRSGETRRVHPSAGTGWPASTVSIKHAFTFTPSMSVFVECTDEVAVSDAAFER